MTEQKELFNIIVTFLGASCNLVWFIDVIQVMEQSQ